VLGRPEQRVERADLDADPAVHAQREVDREPVEHVDLPAPAAARRLDGLLVRVDEDAPVRTLAGAEHAGGAVLLEQRDHPAAAWRQVGPGSFSPGHSLATRAASTKSLRSGCPSKPGGSSSGASPGCPVNSIPNISCV